MPSRDILDPVVKLRSDLHIVGGLVGSFVRSPLQNLYHGLPLHLMPEQVALLAELGAAQIIDDQSAHSSEPSPEQRAAADAALAAEMDLYLSARREYSDQMRAASLAARTRSDESNADSTAQPQPQPPPPQPPDLPISMDTASTMDWYRPEASIITSHPGIQGVLQTDRIQ
eukprot:jgi/Hompol1/286/HPOL_000401-RA